VNIPEVIMFEEREMVWIKGGSIPVTGRGGPYGCEASRPGHFLYNRLKDNGD
jgi:hypothetical protein